MQKLRRGDRRDNALGAGELPEESRHVELPPFICNQQRTIQNQSHAGLSGGRLARARSMSSAKALASSKGSFSNVAQRSANSAQVRVEPGVLESSSVNNARALAGRVSEPRGCTR